MTPQDRERAAFEASKIPFDCVFAILRGAAEHLGRVMEEHPHCDHVQVVKAYEHVWRKMYGYVPLPPEEAAVPSDQPTQAEWEGMAYRFCCLLDHVTGSRMSKPNYELSVMRAVADDHTNDLVEEAVAEARAEIERLQIALEFWLPHVPEADHPMHERISEDALLLRGLMADCGPDAQTLGYISLATPAGIQKGAEPSKSLNAKVADVLRPFLKPGQKVIWREPFRWHDDNGVLPNHYDGMEVDALAEDFGYEVAWEFNMGHAAIITKLRQHLEGEQS